jgi:hypothetical protein
MRKLTIVLMVALAATFGACGGDDGDDAALPEDIVETAADALDDISQDEFVTVDGGDRFSITESCVDTSGVYKGQVEGGGLFILRGGGAPQEAFVDFQPSADADPLSSQSAEDTVLTQEGALTAGTSTVTTEDGANSLELEFQITIGTIDETC